MVRVLLCCLVPLLLSACQLDTLSLGPARPYWDWPSNNGWAGPRYDPPPHRRLPPPPSPPTPPVRPHPHHSEREHEREREHDHPRERERERRPDQPHSPPHEHPRR